jgi:hypothetical protein
MFKFYCGDCGNNWYVGNPRTCTCPHKEALKREWVGLSDEEIDDLSRTMVKGNKSVNWLCQAIEAKLRSKND